MHERRGCPGDIADVVKGQEKEVIGIGQSGPSSPPSPIFGEQQTHREQELRHVRTVIVTQTRIGLGLLEQPVEQRAPQRVELCIETFGGLLAFEGAVLLNGERIRVFV